MPSIPKIYSQRIVQMYGSKGNEFLQSLSKKIALSEFRWKIKVLEPFELSYNYVAPVAFEDKTVAVLKLAFPGKECDNEIFALKQDGGATMCKLIDCVREEGILLLEKLDPGMNLKSVKQESTAVRIACEIINRLKNQSIVPSSAPHQTGRVEDLNTLLNYSDQCKLPFESSTIDKVMQTFTSLINTQGQCYFMHGDFHQENILAHGNTWKLIDPKGLVSEIEYEIIPFLINNLDVPNPFDVVDKRISTFENYLSLDKDRINAWGLCHSVLAAWWKIEDGFDVSEIDLALIKHFDQKT